MNIKDLTWDELEAIMWTILFFIAFYLMFPVSTDICDKLDIPYNLMLSVSSIGFRLELNIILSILFLAVSYCIPKYLIDVLFYKL